MYTIEFQNVNIDEYKDWRIVVENPSLSFCQENVRSFEKVNYNNGYRYRIKEINDTIIYETEEKCIYIVYCYDRILIKTFVYSVVCFTETEVKELCTSLNLEARNNPEKDRYYFIFQKNEVN